jgi:DNA-directed RNA polymerase specialized sigma24 family protein
MHDDSLLLSAIRAGDENAFAVVVERYQARIARYLRRLAGETALAEDLTQETFLSAYTAIRKTGSELSLGPWLYKIATNHAYMHFRKQKVRRLLPFLQAPDTAVAPPADTGIGEQDVVRRALGRLPPVCCCTWWRGSSTTRWARFWAYPRRPPASGSPGAAKCSAGPTGNRRWMSDDLP